MRQRKLLLPPFHGERIRRYGELIREITLREMESWPVGEPFALRPHTQRITLAVIMRAVFGVHDEERLARFERLIETFSGRVNLITAFPTLRRNLGRFSPWARFLRARAALDEFIYEEIALRRAEGERRGRARRRALAAAAAPPRRRQPDERRGAARRAGDGARRRARDDRDGAGLGDGAAAAHTAGAGAAARVDRRRRGRLPRRDDQGDAARAAGDRRRRAQADRAGRDRRLRAAGRDLRPARDRRPPLPRGPLPRAGGVPPRALPRRQGRQLRLDPLRRRRAPLHRRRLRRVRDAGRAAGDPRAGRPQRPRPEPERVKVRNITLAPGRGTAWSRWIGRCGRHHSGVKSSSLHGGRPLGLLPLGRAARARAWRRVALSPAPPRRGRPGGGSASSSSTSRGSRFGQLDPLGEAAAFARRLRRRVSPLASLPPSWRSPPRRCGRLASSRRRW